ncbi:hypothetical protein [Paracoccus sp. JM45]|uniref:hypothetical protein n=1 Tax=Paracoccus sp. JM45 TaxID=2283626 RepID=UPI0016022CF8|nr:hypothetical protein [Paracoccus sp. JM45]
MPLLTLRAPRLSGPILPPPLQIDLDAATKIPQMYLDPLNLLMWGLLIALWAMLLLDGIGQIIDPSETSVARQVHGAVWPFFSAAILTGAIWPWLLDSAPEVMLLGSAATAGLAIAAARRSAGRKRPAISFFAGWATAVLSAGLAGFGSARFGLPVQALSALAILPGAAIGMAAQMWIGPSIGYCSAMIWAFCAFTITTMGSDPVVAVAAVMGISAMAAVLVRAAT